MKQKVLLLFFFIASSPLWAQWTQLTSGTTTDLNDVFFTDNDNGWVVGKSGLIRHTSDGGATWSTQASGTTKELKSIWFTDANNGWICGKDGVVRHTTNGGSTWSTQTSGTGKDLNGLHFIDASNGMAVGEEGVIIGTTNGGATWNVRVSGISGGGSSGDDDDAELNAVQMITSQTAYACGTSGLFVKTTNGGISWTTQTTGVTEDFADLHFPSSGNGYICYQSGKVKNTNGTGTFTSVYATTSKDLKGIWFMTDQKGWVVGDEGRILYTLNGGSSWTSQNLSTVTAELRSVHFPSATTGYCAGKSGTILKLTNADVVSVQELENDHSVQLFPNPANDQINIQLNNTTAFQQLMLYSIEGKLLDAVKISSSNFQYNVSTLEKGIYIVRIISENKAFTTKFIKQ